MGTSPTHASSQSSNPPNPTTFYNSRYKKFEFSQALRQRSAICVEQIQKEIENSSSSKPASRRTSVSGNGNGNPVEDSANRWSPDSDRTTKGSFGDAAAAGSEYHITGSREISRKRHSSQSIDVAEHTDGGAKSARLSASLLTRDTQAAAPSTSSQNVHGSAGNALPATRPSSEYPVHPPLHWTSNTMPNILSDAQRKRGSQQWQQPRK
ncbi:MAG: hypothetical protein J3Q66DRAFT_325212 [Benniella sp.]|nr:MAG: hypothetical protein J3Q66DRAFT_325212 [Benniella sp.]